MPGDNGYDLLCAALESKTTTSLAAETMSTTTFDRALTTMPPPMHSRRNFRHVNIAQMKLAGGHDRTRPQNLLFQQERTQSSYVVFVT